MFDTCEVGLGFNMLSKVEHQNSILTAYNPATILFYCHQLTSNIVLLDDYLENDFTVFMYRE